MQPYDHKTVEEKWRKYWAENPSITSDDKSDKYYCLDMFPYPSGDGLHVGHWRGYVLSDFYARKATLQGKNVLHPMGFDSFGLPAENAAIKNKSHPKKFIDSAIPKFVSQLSSMSGSFNWDRQVITSSPEYYKWTQWLFLQLFKHGLAEKRLSQVNWCPNDQTVLANEQVVNGKCDRCGSEVTKKELKQWFVKTTEFAEELLADLDNLNWPERVKTLQRNWIGKSVGAEILFDSTAGKIKVFTTRADTLFGVTALVLSPEHPMINALVTTEQTKRVNEYLALVKTKTNIDRSAQQETEKTAVFTGSYATLPLVNKKVPIWIADYVLMDYGTGAVMSVPAHDERDFQFATTHDLPVIKVISSNDTPFVGLGKVINSGKYSNLDSESAIKSIVNDSGSVFKINYRLRDWLVSRQRYWGAPIPIVYDPEGNPHPVKEEHLPLLLPEDVDFTPGGDSPIAQSKEFVERAESMYGKGWRFETDTLDTFVDSSWYYLRYLSPTDKDKPFDKQLVKIWLPVDLYIGGIEHATMHLLYARFVTKFLAKYGYIDSGLTEPFKQLFNIGMINLNGSKMSKSKGNVISPDELVEHYGADALRGYELFIAPAEIDAEWSSRGINGVHRFLLKLYSHALTDKFTGDITKEFSQYLTKIEAMAAAFKLNTYISEAMKLLTVITKNGSSKDQFLDFVTTLAPIFPHICEEINQKLGVDKSIFTRSWPELSTDSSAEVEIKILVNQKYIGSIQMRVGASENEVLTAAQQLLSKYKVTRVFYRQDVALNAIID